MTGMVIKNAVSTNEMVAFIAVDFHLLVMNFAHWGWGWFQKELFGPALFQLFKGGYLVISKNSHLLVNFDAIVANKSRTLATERYRLGFRALLTHRFNLSVGFFHFRVEFGHSVDEKGGRQLIWVIFRKNGGISTFWARKGLVFASSPR
ncbi:MAG: hypothetical protein MJE68_29520 [Proteobacteria bacterium]|nr:hypothetical protein [Pseudomonadota bacterium]